ncbi:MAG: tryptophan-rich sensory protein [Cyanobacteria bacterium P01_G01_bin.19]
MYDRQTANSNSILIRQIFTLVSIVAAFAMNIVANVSPPNGLSIGEISNRFFSDVLITPANYAFAVWGVIYLGLISFGVYQALPSQRSNHLLRQIGYKIAIASLAQIVWVICFLYRQYSLSFLAMLGILLPLIGAYLCLPFSRITRWHKLLIRTPISVYLSWIVLATVLNGAIALKSWEWNGWGLSEQVWTIIMLCIAATIAHLVTIPRLDFAYALVFIWGTVAIAVRNAEYLIISGTAIGIGVALIVLLLSFSFYSPVEEPQN